MPSIQTTPLEFGCLAFLNHSKSSPAPVGDRCPLLSGFVGAVLMFRISLMYQRLFSFIDSVLTTGKMRLTLSVLGTFSELSE